MRYANGHEAGFRNLLSLCEFRIPPLRFLVAVSSARIAVGKLGYINTYDSISIGVLFIAHCRCVCMFLLQFTYGVWACVGVFALSELLFWSGACARALLCTQRACVRAYPRCLLSFSSFVPSQTLRLRSTAPFTHFNNIPCLYIYQALSNLS